jgi:hypothetical protein
LLAAAAAAALCVCQVNLLDDHLVDVLLDSAASGWNTVEREGISISHPARFILVGSGEALWEQACKALQKRGALMKWELAKHQQLSSSQELRARWLHPGTYIQSLHYLRIMCVSVDLADKHMLQQNQAFKPLFVPVATLQVTLRRESCGHSCWIASACTLRWAKLPHWLMLTAPVTNVQLLGLLLRMASC